MTTKKEDKPFKVTSIGSTKGKRFATAAEAYGYAGRKQRATGKTFTVSGGSSLDHKLHEYYKG